MNYSDVIKRHNGKCELCDRRAKRIFASNVYDPKLTAGELREQNFRHFCEKCASSHISWTIQKAVGGNFHLFIWELMQDGSIKEL